MELLDQYLKAVKPYLPRAQRTDILKELFENIRSQMEDQETQLGRPLDEREQEAILTRYGQPMMVAGRYRQDEGSFVFGLQLIGPELFPLYIRILCLNLGITAALFLGLIFFTGRLSSVSEFLFPAFIQYATITLIFIAVDRWERKTHHWHSVPAHLRPIPRWQSAVGLVAWVAATFWMVAAPFFPSLLFGPLAGNLKLAPGWPGFLVPILLLMVAGIVQRGINLVHPDWTWLMPATRLAVNSMGAAILFLFRNSHLVIVADSSGPFSNLPRLAEIFNAAIIRGLLGYLLVNVIIYACVFAPHVRRWTGDRSAKNARILPRGEAA